MKIAMVGSCPSSRLLAPYNDPEWKIWGLSPDNVDQLPRVDAWFELHGDMDWPDQYPPWRESYIGWLNDPAKSFDLFVNAGTVHLFNRRPVSVFPATELVAEYGPYWFTSSIAWMMGYALSHVDNVEEIGLFGIDMAAKTEYNTQKPAVRRWIEIVRAAGIKVTIPDESDLDQPPPLYGYSYLSQMGKKLTVREREIKNRLLQAQVKKTQLMREMDQEIFHLQGSLDQLDYTIQTWTNFNKERP